VNPNDLTIYYVSEAEKKINKEENTRKLDVRYMKCYEGRRKGRKRGRAKKKRGEGDRTNQSSKSLLNHLPGRKYGTNVVVPQEESKRGLRGLLWREGKLLADKIFNHL
jgi:hypothetical protein